MDQETRRWAQQEADRMQRILNKGPHEPRWDQFDFTVPGDDEKGTLKKRVHDIARAAFGNGMLTSGLLDAELTIEVAGESDAQPDD